MDILPTHSAEEVSRRMALHGRSEPYGLLHLPARNSHAQGETRDHKDKEVQILRSSRFHPRLFATDAGLKIAGDTIVCYSQ